MCFGCCRFHLSIYLNGGKKLSSCIKDSHSTNSSNYQIENYHFIIIGNLQRQPHKKCEKYEHNNSAWMTTKNERKKEKGNNKYHWTGYKNIWPWALQHKNYLWRTAFKLQPNRNTLIITIIITIIIPFVFKSELVFSELGMSIYEGLEKADKPTNKQNEKLSQRQLCSPLCIEWRFGECGEKVNSSQWQMLLKMLSWIEIHCIRLFRTVVAVVVVVVSSTSATTNLPTKK